MVTELIPWRSLPGEKNCGLVCQGNLLKNIGRKDELRNDLKSVEAFNFELYHYRELPEMSQGRAFHPAVLV